MRENMTTKEAARELQVSTKRVTDLIKAGVLHAEKVAGVWLIDPDSVHTRKQQVNKRGGRPKTGNGRSEARYTLYNREIPCLELVYDEEENRFKHVGAVLDEQRCPIWLFGRRGNIALSAFNTWWRGRGIPDERGNIHEILESEGVRVPEELIRRNLGLSLSDQYWISPQESQMRWADINFFHNDFRKRTVGSEDGGYLDGAHPDNTSDGNLEKFWTIEGGRRVLNKAGGTSMQEPLNERIATRFFAKVLEPDDFVDYHCEKVHGRFFSKCEDFLADDEEYVPAHYIQRMWEKPNHVNSYQHYVDCCTKLGVGNIEEFLSKMIVCDFLLMNHDRHYRNFGLVRNVHMLEWRVAPLFDTGSSLLCDVNDYDVVQGLYTFKSKPFFEKPRKQLLLADEPAWLDPAALGELCPIVEEVLGEYDCFEKRLPHLLAALQRQARIVELLF